MIKKLDSLMGFFYFKKGGQMANTTYQDVNDMFMLLQNDYRLISLYQDDLANTTSNLDTLLYGWMVLSIGEFGLDCTQDLSNRNETTKEFNFVMTDENINLLAKFMVKYWLQKEVSDILQMRNKIQTDFKSYSEAQSLATKKGYLIEVIERLDQDMTKYGYKNFDWQQAIDNGFETLMT
jgi:hypothetical protein